MDVLLAPVFESFLAVRDKCLAYGGFVVGPIGTMTAENLFEYSVENGARDTEFPHRFSFDPWLASVIYETHVKEGPGGFRYLGLIDEIEINADIQPYRFPKMKPGEGHHGEHKYDERMPAFIRFKVVKPVAEVMPGAHLWPRDVGCSETVLRHFKIKTVRKPELRQVFERMLAAVGKTLP